MKRTIRIMEFEEEITRFITSAKIYDRFMFMIPIFRNKLRFFNRDFVLVTMISSSYTTPPVSK